ncbi:MAG TPA: DUF2867 domain-containing protein [Mycobacteriales bacterium]|nr:DUF2867 domain-containing protein [Mycobacteriales bacterium]
MRLPDSTLADHPWVITQIAPDFRLLDVWALPAEGGPADFGTFLDVMAALDPAAGQSAPSRALFQARLRIGEVLGWDEAKDRPIPGCTETSLAARLPADLQGSAASPVPSALQRSGGGFLPLYRTADEWAAEISNETVHAVLHVAWVPLSGDRYGPQLRVFVKARGRFGSLYLKAIEPFRLLVVYPALMRQVELAWEASRPD